MGRTQVPGTQVKDATINTVDLVDKAVTLKKMADVASGSVFYRKTSGTGSPEVQDLNTLRNDLGVFPKLTTSIDLIAFVNHGGNVVVKMGRFIYWNSDFVTVYRRITPILKTVVPFSSMTGFNTFTGTRWRFKNDIPDNTTADMITDISFNAGSGVVAGNSIIIEYTETPRQLSSQLSLVYKGWDFAHDRPYAKSPTGNFPAQPMLTYSAIIPKKFSLQDGAYTIQYFDPSNWNDLTLPPYISAFVKRNHDGRTGYVHYLFPNMMYFSEIGLGSAFSGFRVEAYELPRRSKKQPSGYAKFIGYWTINKMRLTNTIMMGTGYRRRYYTIGFKIRNLSTNDVSNWLPLIVIANRRFKGPDGTKALFVRFRPL